MSSLFLFLLSFSFVTVILEPFSGLRNLPFDAFSLKWLQISLGWFSKNRLDIYLSIILIYQPDLELFSMEML